MSKLTFHFILVFPFLVFAGGNGGGGGVRPEVGRLIDNNLLRDPLFIKDLNQIKLQKEPKIIYARPSKNGITQMATGSLIENNWQIDQFLIPTEALESSNLKDVVLESAETNEWIELKN